MCYVFGMDIHFLSIKPNKKVLEFIIDKHFKRKTLFNIMLIIGRFLLALKPRRMFVYPEQQP